MRFYKWGGVLLVLASIAILLVLGFKKGSEEISLSTTTIKKGDFVISVKARGEVLPSKEHKVASLLSGVVNEILVDEGDNVRKGQILLMMDKLELLSRLKGIEKDIVSYQNRLQELNEGLEIKRAEKLFHEARLAFEDEKREYDSLSRLYEMKAISLKDLEKSQSRLLKSEENLRLAEKELESCQRKKELELNLVLAQLKEAHSNYDWIKKQLSWIEVKSPIDGVVIEKGPDVLVNNMISQGMHLFTIAPLSYRIKALIDEIDIGKISIGKVATVKIDAYPYKPITSFIKNISPQPIISKEGGIREFEVYLEDIKIDDLKVTPRMQCSVEIVSVIPNVLKVALADIVEEKEKRYVFLIEKGRIKKRMIKTGLENEEEAEILSGLKEGETIIKSPSLIKEGIKISD